MITAALVLLGGYASVCGLACVSYRTFLYPAPGGVAAGRWAGPSNVLGQVANPPASVPKDLPTYRDIVKQVLPAVVSIVPKAKMSVRASASSPPRT